MPLIPSEIIRVLGGRHYRLSEAAPRRKNPTKKIAGYVSPAGTEHVYVHLENVTGKSALRIHPRHAPLRARLLELEGVESESLYTANSNMWRFPNVPESGTSEPCGIPFTFESASALRAFLDAFEAAL